MADNPDKVLALLQSQYDDLRERRDDVFAAASPFTTSQRTAYVSAVNQALTNYLTAFNGLINANDDEIKHITDTADAAQKTLDGSLSDLTSLANKINLVTNALTIVAQVLTVIAP